MVISTLARFAKPSLVLPSVTYGVVSKSYSYYILRILFRLYPNETTSTNVNRNRNSNLLQLESLNRSCGRCDPAVSRLLCTPTTEKVDKNLMRMYISNPVTCRESCSMLQLQVSSAYVRHGLSSHYHHLKQMICLLITHDPGLLPVALVLFQPQYEAESGVESSYPCHEE